MLAETDGERDHRAPLRVSVVLFDEHPPEQPPLEPHLVTIGVILDREADPADTLAAKPPDVDGVERRRVGAGVELGFELETGILQHHRLGPAEDLALGGGGAAGRGERQDERQGADRRGLPHARGSTLPRNEPARPSLEPEEMPMIRDRYLEDALLQLRKYKKLADRAIAQVDDEQLFTALDPESNSIAIIMKHMAGNMRSRWTDFLTTDGEKPDRDRDTEFEQCVPRGARGRHGENAADLRRVWDAGWELTIAAIAELGWQDLEREVTIRGEPHGVIQAINRQLTHYAYHVGQIVLLARHFAGPGWRWLSIPPGKSAEYEVSQQGEPYPVDDGDRS